MSLHVKRECITITYTKAFIALQQVSLDIFNGIFSDATSNILSVHLQFSCTALMVLLYTFFKNSPKYQVWSGDLGGHDHFEIIMSPKSSSIISVVTIT